jgi:hypothetical protein
METPSTSPSPEQAASALRAADSAGATLAGGLLLPSHFSGWIGTAAAVQIGTAAEGIYHHNAWGLVVAMAGLLVAFGVGATQIARFRSLNGVRVGGFESRVVGGTANTASTVYGLAFGGALWAAFVDMGWLVGVSSVLGGIGYAMAGRQWWKAYQRDPAGNSRGDSALWLTVLACTGCVGMVALVIGS